MTAEQIAPPQRAGRASAHQRGRNGYEPMREAAMAAFAKSWRQALVEKNIRKV